MSTSGRLVTNICRFWNMKVQANELLNKVKDRLSWGWHPKVRDTHRGASITMKIGCWCGNGKHLFQMVDQDTIARLLHPFPVCRIETVDVVATELRVCRKLD
jgi:hypothetical protein